MTPIKNNHWLKKRHVNTGKELKLSCWTSLQASLHIYLDLMNLKFGALWKEAHCKTLSMYVSPGAEKIIVCIRTQNNLLLIYECVSYSLMFPVLIWHQLWFNIGSWKKEQSSLARGWDTFLSHPLSLRNTCSVSRWDQEGGAVEGIGRVQLEAGAEADEGPAREMGRRRAVHSRYQPMPQTRVEALVIVVWFLAMLLQLIVMAVVCEHGRGSSNSKGLAI